MICHHSFEDDRVISKEEIRDIVEEKNEWTGISGDYFKDKHFRLKIWKLGEHHYVSNVANLYEASNPRHVSVTARVSTFERAFEMLDGLRRAIPSWDWDATL